MLIDEQADQIFASTHAIAERARKLDRTMLRSVGHVSRLQRLADNDAEVEPRATDLPHAIGHGAGYDVEGTGCYCDGIGSALAGRRAPTDQDS